MLAQHCLNQHCPQAQLEVAAVDSPPARGVVPLARLWTAMLFGYLALGATLQELPRYVAGRFHAGPFALGVTVGLAFAGTAAARPLAGRAGDTGRSRGTAIAGALLTALAAAGHLLAPNLGALLVARLLMGVGEAALFSGTLPWVLAGVQRSRAGRVAGWFGLSMWGGLSAGPLLAVCASRLGGSGAVWSLVIALPLVSAVLVASTPRRAVPPVPWIRRGLLPRGVFPRGALPRGALPRGALPRGALPRGAGTTGVVVSLASFGYGTLTALLVLFLGTLGGGTQGYGLAVFSAAFLVTRAAGSPLVDRYGGLPVVRVVLLIESSGLALLAVARDPYVALGAIALAGVGLGLIYPAGAKLTLHRASATAQGAAVGAMTSFWDLGILAAGPAAGLIAASAGFRAAFLAAAVLPVVALAVTVGGRLTGDLLEQSEREREWRPGGAAAAGHREPPLCHVRLIERSQRHAAADGAPGG